MQALDMEALAAKLDVTVSVSRFLLCFFATVPVGFLCRFVPGGPKFRHLYSALTGAILSYLSFGFSSNLHFLVPILLAYTSMILCRKYCGVVTFILGFSYLIGCHVYYMSGDAWKEGGIDSTGALMVLTLKVISCAISYNDGLVKDEILHDSQKSNRLLKLPSFIEFFGYCLCCGSHFAGPVYEAKDYIEWVERKGIWSGRQPLPFWATIRALVQAGVCMVVYLKLMPYFSLTILGEQMYAQSGFWRRWGYQYMAGFTARWKYYFVWSVSEASIIVSGFGFSGWTSSSPPKPRWDRAKNVDVLGVELATSAVQLPLVWNIQVSKWLRIYVYERLIQKGRKPGFLQLLASQSTSAIWHGLYPGYAIFFVHSAMMIAGSRVIYRWKQSVPLKLGFVRRLLTLGNFAYTVFVLNATAVGFLVLSWHETLAAYRSVHYVGTLVPLIVIFLGKIIDPARSKARKVE